MLRVPEKVESALHQGPLGASYCRTTGEAQGPREWAYADWYTSQFTLFQMGEPCEDTEPMLSPCVRLPAVIGWLFAPPSGGMCETAVRKRRPLHLRARASPRSARALRKVTAHRPDRPAAAYRSGLMSGVRGHPEQAL